MSYATGSPEMDRLLDGVSSAQIDPDGVFTHLRSCFAALSDQHEDVGVAYEAVYAAFLKAVWTFVASGANGSNLNRWMHLVLRVRQFMRVHKSTIAERLTTLSDMLEQSANVAEKSDRPKLGKNHLLVLSLLQERKGELARTELAKETGLKDSNLSHVLSKLAASRLIDRIPIGREANIRITEQGRKAISGPEKSSAPDDLPASACDWFPYPIAIVDVKSSSVRCNEAFAGILETKRERLEKMPTKVLRQSLAAKVQNAELGEFMGADGCARRLVETSKDDHTFWLAFDVSMYRRRIEELEKRESVLARELTEVRSQRAAPATASPRLRDGVSYHDLYADRFDFAGMIKQLTPDVMTPVSSIEATARLLCASKYLKGDDLAYCAAIVDNSNHLKNVLGGLIAVADADPFAHVAAPFRPHSIAMEIAKNFAVSSKARGYTIAALHPDADHEVMADEYAFRAALQSSVAGVVRVVPRGASVGIRTMTHRDGIEVELVARHIETAGHSLPSNTFMQLEAFVSGFGARFDQVGYGKDYFCTKYHWPSERRRGR
jgi:DNA-binding MarR family transcriptional regulator